MGCSAVPATNPVRHSLSKSEKVPEGQVGFLAASVPFLLSSASSPSLQSMHKGTVGANPEKPISSNHPKEGSKDRMPSEGPIILEILATLIALPGALLHTEFGER